MKDAIEELRRSGVLVGMFRPITLWPSPESKLREIGKKIDKIIVIELNLGQYVNEIQRIIGDKIRFYGKSNGRAITPNEIINIVKEM